MPKKILQLTALFFVISVSASWVYLKANAQSGEVTTTFQYGTNSYQGVVDTFVSSQSWANPPQYSLNYGQNQNLIITRGGRDNILMRFDLASIPQHAAVSQATLAVYCHGSDCSTSHSRNIGAWQVLKNWNEGTEVAGPITASGKRGATGDFAVEYFTGEGTDVPWASRGLQRDSDYRGQANDPSQPLAQTTVTGTGWVELDVTSLVQQWTSNPAANNGLLLTDMTDYQAGNPDSRTFISSQNPTLANRPKLTVTYNPEAPNIIIDDIYQADFELGSALTLDASRSTNPVGSLDSVNFTWKVIEKAYGSTVTDTAITPSSGTGAFRPTFIPDKHGNYLIEVAASVNGNTDVHRMIIRVLDIPQTHPRIWLTPERIQRMRQAAASNSEYWQEMQSETGLLASAIKYQISNDPAHAQAIVNATLPLLEGTESCSPDYAGCAGGMDALALGYDFAYDFFTPEQRQQIIDRLNQKAARAEFSTREGLHNYAFHYILSYGLAGVATYWENPEAQRWLDNARTWRYQENVLPLWEHAGPGGGWAEGSVYGSFTSMRIAQFADALYSGTGEDIFESNPWFQDRIKYELMMAFPGTIQIPSYHGPWRNYPALGDSERNRNTMADYDRVTSFILTDRYADSDASSQLFHFRTQPPVSHMSVFQNAEQFLWSDPGHASTAPSLLTHLAAGTGTLFARSDWSDDATYVQFQCGDFWTYHQHWDQNAFNIFKYEDLAVESGVYDGSGNSAFDVNYTARTIAHNTMLFYDPNERIGRVRSGEEADNDGGQHAFTGGAQVTSPEHLVNHPNYESCNIVAFEDAATHTLISGDATRAYSSALEPAVVQYTGSDKLKKFVRSLVYLRPIEAGGKDFVVIYDDVETTDPAFQKYWIMHTVNDPDLNDREASATNNDGKIFFKNILPADAEVRKVSGYQYFGQTYTPVGNEFEDQFYGEHRLEVVSSGNQAAETFLNVLYPTSSTTTENVVMQNLTPTGGDGVLVDNRAVIFAPADQEQINIQYTLAAESQIHHLVANLPPLTQFNIYQQGQLLAVESSSDSGSISFTSTQGGAFQVTLGDPDPVPEPTSVASPTAINIPPTITITPDQDVFAVTIGETLSIDVEATDPEGSDVTLEAQGLENLPGATFE